MKHITELELIEYAAGSIALPQKAKIEGHLAECEPCRQKCEQTKLVYDSLADLAVPQIPDLRAKVLRRATVAGGWHGQKRSVAMSFVQAAAAIVITAIAGYFVAVAVTSHQQSDSAAALKAQSEISFITPARHIAMAVTGESK